MEPIKVAICDDVEQVRIEILNFLKNYFVGKRVRVEYSLFSDGVDLVTHSIDFDIIILDIKMNYMDGFQVRDQLFAKCSHARIIYLTDYDNLVYKGYGKNVYGFVTKDRISELERYMNIILNEYKDHHFITITKDPIDIYNIVYVQANNGYCHFFDNRGNEKVYRIQIGEVVDKLQDYHGMKRTHRSYLVNFRYVQKIDSKYVYIKVETENIKIPVSKAYVLTIQKDYFNFIKGRINNG